ncbi:MAG TPA: hypothetical protein VFB07_01325 [Vicinamibacterales bacterium]|nr:hypothetical protein [Vicinamibacterales bacterium]
MSRTTLVLLVTTGCLWASIPADAQTADVERGYITAAADFLGAGSGFTDEIHPIDFGEAATVAGSYQVKFAPGFAVGGGARVWRRLALGVEAGRVSHGNTADVSAQVPHPFFFNKPRAVTGSASGLDRAELAVHVIASWVAPVADRWQLSVGGGPSWITVDQAVISDVTVTQTYPYDTATFAGAVTRKASKGHVGVNAGVEAAYLLRPRAALAFGARFSHAHVPLTDTASTDAGGLHATAGLRLRF